MNIQTYHNNLNALANQNPVLFARLATLKENQKYNVYFSPNDPIDTNIQEVASKTYLYKKPIDDTAREIEKNQKFDRYPFLVYFGFGNGVFVKALLENKNHERIVVVEPELEILFIALHLLDFSEDIHKNRLTIYLAEDIDFHTVRNYIGSKQVGHYLKLYDLHITLPYYSKYNVEIAKTNRLFTDSILHFVKAHGNDATDSIIGIEHFIRNIPRMLKNPPFHYLLTLKNAETAIIVSTGPSLTKQLPLLKEIQESVLIICVDASMPILEKWGIKPDIVASMERVTATAKFFEETSKEFQKDIVFVSSALQHKVIYKNIKAGQLVIPMRPFGYMEFFNLNAYGYCGIGLSAANMAFEIAYLMGCKNLVFIGQDLAYANDGKSHASNHVYGEDEVKSKESDSYIPAYGGNGTVKTTEIWRLFLGYFINYVADSKHGMTSYNCTEGGARIDGTIEIPFKDAIDKLIDKNFKKEKIILPSVEDKIIKKNMLYAHKKIDEFLKYAQDSKNKIEELFLEVAKQCDELEDLNKQNKLHAVDFNSIKKTLKKIDKIKAMMRTKKFHQLFWDTIQSFILSQELELAVIAVKPAKTEMELNAKLISFLFAHKSWLFMLAGGMDSVIAVVSRSKKEVDKEVMKIKERG